MSIIHQHANFKTKKKFYLPLVYKNNKFKTLIVCSDGVITEKLCPDGMVFNDYSIDQEKCDLPFNLDCSKRSKLREYLISYIRASSRLSILKTNGKSVWTNNKVNIHLMQFCVTLKRICLHTLTCLDDAIFVIWFFIKADGLS